jgi:uncharacterized membrane protein
MTLREYQERYPKLLGQDCLAKIYVEGKGICMSLTFSLLNSAILGGTFSTIGLILNRQFGGVVTKRIEQYFPQSAWALGGMLFVLNAALFSIFSLIALKSISTALSVGPFIMAISVIGWTQIGNCSGNVASRLKTGFIAGSFYLVVFTFSLIKLLTLEQQFPGNDNFMTALGFMLIGLITGTAALTCILLILFSKKVSKA